MLHSSEEGTTDQMGPEKQYWLGLREMSKHGLHFRSYFPIYQLKNSTMSTESYHKGAAAKQTRLLCQRKRYIHVVKK